MDFEYSGVRSRARIPVLHLKEKESGCEMEELKDLKELEEVTGLKEFQELKEF